MGAWKKLNQQDVYLTTYTAKKSWTIESSSFNSQGSVRQYLAHSQSSTTFDLRDEDLISLVEYLLTNGTLRRPLQGNVRFLQSVAVRFRRRNTLSLKQREGILKILLKAYPHNLAHELRGSIQKTC